MKSKLFAVTGLAILLLTVLVVPVAAQFDLESLLTSLEGNETVSGVDRYTFREVNADSSVSVLCIVRVRMMPDKTLEDVSGHTWEELSAMGLQGAASSVEGRSYTFNADMSFCTPPTGFVTIGEPMPVPAPKVETDLSQQAVQATPVLPRIPPPDPGFLTALVASLAPWILIALVFQAFASA